MVSASASLRVTRTLETPGPLVPSMITPAQLEIPHLFCLNSCPSINGLFAQSLRCSKNNPRNIKHMPAVIFFRRPWSWTKLSIFQRSLYVNWVVKLPCMYWKSKELPDHTKKRRYTITRNYTGSKGQRHTGTKFMELFTAYNQSIIDSMLLNKQK